MVIDLDAEATVRACSLLTRLYDRRNRVHRKGVRVPATFPKADLEWLRERGLAPNRHQTLSHAQVVSQIVTAQKRHSLREGARAFVESLGGGPPHGVLLEAVLLAHRMPKHPFSGRADPNAKCRVCSMRRKERIDATERFLDWHANGSGLPGDPLWAVLGLERLAASPTARTSATSRARLAMILRTLDSLPDGARAKAAMAAVSDLEILGPDPKGHRAGAVVETLAFAGVLEAPPHHGLATEWVSATDRDRRPNMRVEVDAPLGFWRGSNGVNWGHAELLFGLTREAARSAKAPPASGAKPAPAAASAGPKNVRRLSRRPAEPGDVWAIRVREDAYVLVYVWSVEPGSRPLARTEYLDWFGSTPPTPDRVRELGIRGRPNGRAPTLVHGLHKTSGTALIATALRPPADARPVPDHAAHGSAKGLVALADWCFPELRG